MRSNFWVIQTLDIAVGAVSLKHKQNWFNLYERCILKTVTLNYAFKIVFAFNFVSWELLLYENVWHTIEDPDVKEPYVPVCQFNSIKH